MKKVLKYFKLHRGASHVKDCYSSVLSLKRPYLKSRQQNNNSQVYHHDCILADEFQFVRWKDTMRAMDSEVKQYVKQVSKHYERYMDETSSIRGTLRKQLKAIDDRVNDGHPSVTIELYNENWMYVSFYAPHLVIIRVKLQDQSVNSIVTLLNQTIDQQQPFTSKLISDYVEKRTSDTVYEVVYDKNIVIERLKERGNNSQKRIKITIPADLVRLSPCQRYMAFTYTCDGISVLDVQNIEDQTIVHTIQSAEEITSFEFNRDGDKMYYVVANSHHRSYKVLSHDFRKRNSNAVILEEDDETFYLELYRSKDNEILFINSGNRTTSETFLINESSDQAVVIKRRKEGELFYPEHNGKYLIAVTNSNHAANLEVVRTDMNDPDAKWVTIYQPESGTKINDIDVFKDYIILYEKHNGLDRLRVIELNEGNLNYCINMPECATIHRLANNNFNANHLLIANSNIVSPSETFLVDIQQRQLIQLNLNGPSLPVSNYVVSQVYVSDSVSGSNFKIPMIIAHRRDIKLDGNNPTLVLGYGAYGHPTDLSFEWQQQLLLDNAFVIAIPQVRGGGDGDLSWHHDGTKLNKKNSFSDFLNCVQYLIDNKYTNPSLICAKGVSAGGLLVASSAMLKPELFRSILLKVPFLDVTTTMLDKSLPLTELEKDEWGDPLASSDVFNYIESYSPYAQLRKISYPVNKLPDMYITAATEDYHVPAWQMLKFTARLWDIMKTQNSEQPIAVLRILDSGHGDEAGKQGMPEDIAAEYAFIFMTLGIQPKQD